MFKEDRKMKINPLKKLLTYKSQNYVQSQLNFALQYDSDIKKSRQNAPRVNGAEGSVVWCSAVKCSIVQCI